MPESKDSVDMGNSTVSLLKTPQMGKSSNFVRNSSNPCTPRLPVRSFLPSWNSHQVPGSADGLKICPLITAHVGVENKGGKKKKLKKQTIVLEVKAASKKKVIPKA